MKLNKSDLLESIDAYLYSANQLDFMRQINLPIGDEIQYTLLKHEKMLYKE